MDSAVRLLIGLAGVAVLSAGFYFGGKLLVDWLVVGRPSARFRRALDRCPDIAGAAGR